MLPAAPVPLIADEIWQAAEGRINACRDGKLDGTGVAEALIAIEMSRRAPVRVAFENQMVRAHLWLGARPPDWSLGAAQVRPSTAVEVGEASSMRDAAARLIGERCYSLRVARAFVSRALRECSRALTRVECEIAVARRYNGQKALNAQNMMYLRVFRSLRERARG